jgi:phage tail-like protein
MVSGARTAERTLEGIDVELRPDFLTMEVFPDPPELALDRYEALWHRAEPKRYAVVNLASTDGKAHKVRIRLEPSHSGWRTSWARWTYLQRKARELQGGVALDEQDQVSGDGQSMTAMVLANESRTVSLELSPSLSEGVMPGTYGFDVVIVDDQEPSAGEIRKPGFLTLEHPRGKLMAMLPSIYSEEMQKLRDEDNGESPFFERYLLGFEDALRPLQRTLDRLDTLFGPFSTPPEFLLWLGTWVCLPLDENWSEMQRRQLIKEAVDLWRWRGTKRGLTRYIEIYVGVKPEIHDVPVRGMRLGPDTKMGAAETKLGDVPAHTFVVSIASPNPERINEQIVHDIIAWEKPAHTAYSLRILGRSS